MKDFNILLFDGFETLDAFGPAEIISKMSEQYQLKYYSMNGGIVTSSQDIQVNTLCIDALLSGEKRGDDSCDYCEEKSDTTSSEDSVGNSEGNSEGNSSGYVFMIPGGPATRTLVNDDSFISKLRSASKMATHVLTVCTGTALLAKAGEIDGVKATSNKMAFDWVITQSEKVEWIREARWVIDGNFYTSSGVSAGMDMTLGFIADLHGESESVRIAREIEYIWNKDKTQDPFA